jgi:hypothetical protein
MMLEYGATLLGAVDVERSCPARVVIMLEVPTRRV